MLHHGHLTSRLPHFILKYILNKFNTIYTLNNRQADFYKSICSNLPLIEETSYVPATLVGINETETKPLTFAKENHYKIIIGSGFPRKLYQHHILIDVINKNLNTFLFLFIYGEGELKQELLHFSHPSVVIFFDKDEDIFNFYLSQANLYVRPTLEDSFGIACADAIEFGVYTIASDVCKRYQSVKTYSTINDLYKLIDTELSKV